MDLTIRGDNVNVTSEMEDFVQKKLSKLSRYMPNIESVYVELALQKSVRGPDLAVAQITLRHSRGAILRTEEKTERVEHGSMKAAVTAASDKMYRRIRRFKGKTRNKRVRDRYAMSQDELMVAEPLPDDVEVQDADYGDVPDAGVSEPQIIRRKMVGISAMNDEEAIEQMELLGHNFFMFFNADSNTINVVYRRSNGGYGILEPQVE